MRGGNAAFGKENADLIARYSAGFCSGLAQKKWIDCLGMAFAACGKHTVVRATAYGGLPAPARTGLPGDSHACPCSPIPVCEVLPAGL